MAYKRKIASTELNSFNVEELTVSLTNMRDRLDVDNTSARDLGQLKLDCSRIIHSHLIMVEKYRKMEQICATTSTTATATATTATTSTTSTTTATAATATTATTATIAAHHTTVSATTTTIAAAAYAYLAATAAARAATAATSTNGTTITVVNYKDNNPSLDAARQLALDIQAANITTADVPISIDVQCIDWLLGPNQYMNIKTSTGVLVGTLKELINQQQNAPGRVLHLKCFESLLENGRTLGSYGIKDGDTIRLRID